MKDVILDETEISMQANKMIHYIEYLNSLIAEYDQILQNIISNAIVDARIRSKLIEYINQTNLIKAEISAYGKLLKNDLNAYINKMEQVEKFEFPNEEMYTISSILARFL